MRQTLSPLPRTSGDLLADRRYAYAVAFLADGDASAAADLAAQTLERAPDFAPAWALLGRARVAVGDRDAAVEALRRALALEPADELGVGIELARLGARPAADAISFAFVGTLFDQYADRFEEHLTRVLGYRAPRLLLSALERHGAPERFSRALDLGCGTGLMGETLRPRCDTLVGCDLSRAMIEKARVKGVYDRLAVAEMTAFLAEEAAGASDLVVAADVLIYVGDPRHVLAGGARALAKGGMMAFTLQRHDGEGFIVGEDARFSHSPAFVAQTAQEAGFEIVSIEEASARRDAGRDVPGLVVVLRR